MKGIYEYRCIHQIACLAYCPRATSMLYCGHNSRGRRHNDGRRASSIPESPGMEPLQEKEKRERVFLRYQVATWGCLPRSCFKGGKYHRGSSLGETSQSSVTKIKPASGWQWKQFTAVRLPLSQPGKLARDNHRINLPTFSIHRSLPYDKVCYTKRGYARGRYTHG